MRRLSGQTVKRTRVSKLGYVLVRVPNHPRSGPRGFRRVQEHVLVAEAALGRFLALGHHVHHINGIKTDNRSANLVVCEDSRYHQLLHTRQRALDACGNADWRRCCFCGQFDDPATMSIHRRRSGNPSQFCHRACKSALWRRRRDRMAREITQLTQDRAEDPQASAPMPIQVTREPHRAASGE